MTVIYILLGVVIVFWIIRNYAVWKARIRIRLLLWKHFRRHNTSPKNKKKMVKLFNDIDKYIKEL